MQATKSEAAGEGLEKTGEPEMQEDQALEAKSRAALELARKDVEHAKEILQYLAEDKTKCHANLNDSLLLIARSPCMGPQKVLQMCLRWMLA